MVESFILAASLIHNGWLIVRTRALSDVIINETWYRVVKIRGCRFLSFSSASASYEPRHMLEQDLLVNLIMDDSMQ